MKQLVFALAAISLATSSCSKQEIFASASLEEYMPMQVGKYIRYRLDSMVFVHFGQQDSLITWEAKDLVEEELTDQLGRKTFRVVRYLRDISSTNEDDYFANKAFFVTPTREVVEWVEDNLRFQKLRLPVNEGFHWLGNSLLPYAPYAETYEFSNDENMGQWTYTYQDVNQPASVNNLFFEETLTVIQVADSTNVPIMIPEGMAQRSHWEERYAKGVGLIYKEVLLWEYQPPFSGNAGYRTGFGLRMSILDHN